MTRRTKLKLDENLELVIESVKRILGVEMRIEDPREQQLRYLIYNALSWTAEDVEKQQEPAING